MKDYIKPELFYERYELAQHIANCDWELTQADGNTCFANPDPNELGSMPTLFTRTDLCDSTDWENYCYQPGGKDDIKVFMS